MLVDLGIPGTFVPEMVGCYESRSLLARRDIGRNQVLVASGVLNEPTAFCCREVTTVSIEDLGNRVGSVSERVLNDACATLAWVFDCRDKADVRA